MDAQMGRQVGDQVADLVTGRSPRPVHINYYWSNFSIGRHDGVALFTRPDDRPLPMAVLTGRTSARFKETITRGVIWSIRRPGPDAY